MKFLKKTPKPKKQILVISDLHLGAGQFVEGRKNPLEDFHSDRELCDFLNHYSSEELSSSHIELIINGDFYDLLATPFVPFYDNDFWSEKASLNKLKMCIEAHGEVITALDSFLSSKNKTITYIIGNHDAEFVFDSLQILFKSYFKEDNRNKIYFISDGKPYNPSLGIYLQHGHEYEEAHRFEPEESIFITDEGEKYFKPSWGAYYVMNVINRYKEEREYVNSVRPIKNFLIHGFLFDTFFIMRFLVANAYYFFMVRFLFFYRKRKNLPYVFSKLISDLKLFQDYEKLTEKFFSDHENAKVLLVGHTHEAIDREYNDGTRFINTGTWTRMVNLDLKTNGFGEHLTFASIEILNSHYTLDSFEENVTIELLEWKGITTNPYQLFR